MFERFRPHVLRLLKVPHDPDPPAGATGSLRVFRAGKNFYKLRLLRWVAAQIGALIGILFSLHMLGEFERGTEAAREELALESARRAPVTAPALTPAPEAADAPAIAPAKAAKSRPGARQRMTSTLQRVAERWPVWLFPLIKLLEFAGIVAYVAQVPFTYALARLDWEMRWYMVTDRSLRIRAGLATVQETTMSFANVQQVVVSQGPLQRLLGIADVRVQSAGGGGDQREGHGETESLHTGIFHGVDNANQIRDLILDRLRQFRATGLGDPDESPATVASLAEPPSMTTTTTVDVTAAARELVAEARALRQSLG